MIPGARNWDYLVVTAANPRQAAAYGAQLQPRRAAGQLDRFREVLALPDPDGRRIGSGGSTIQCLIEILNREAAGGSARDPWSVLGGLRVLIVHAGGDSRRVPAYSPCGKIFTPLPGGGPAALPTALFDRLVAKFLELPPGAAGAGQVVVAAGDALLLFDAAAVDFSRPGITALAALASPEEASRHGVLCPDGAGRTRLYLQKPSLEQQRAHGAVGARGLTPLDIGVMSFDGPSAAALLDLFCRASEAGLVWREEMIELVFAHGLDLYREICCAMGTEATPEHYLRTALASGSKWPASALARLFPALRAIPLPAEILENCGFLHFGSTRQLISSGLALLERDAGAPPRDPRLVITTLLEGDGAIEGAPVWVEACHVRAPLILGGNNVVTGAGVDRRLELPPHACLDVCKGPGDMWFVRCYGAGDTFKHPVGAGATFCGMLLSEWLETVGAAGSEVWDEGVPAADRTLWNARVFPAVREPAAFREWLWMFDVGRSSRAWRQAFRSARRYSAAEIALLADQEAFHSRRAALHRRLHPPAAHAAAESEIS